MFEVILFQGACESVQGNKTAAASIPGLIDGFGSIFASVVNIVIPHVEKGVFWIFTCIFQSSLEKQYSLIIYSVFCLVSGVIILPLACKECKVVLRRKKDKKLKKATTINLEVSNSEPKDSASKKSQSSAEELKTSSAGSQEIDLQPIAANKPTLMGVVSLGSVLMDIKDAQLV